MIEELGIKPIINASGTLTLLGGCLVEDVAMDAMSEMSRIFVDMNELHEKVGAFIAKLVESEAAYVTSGAAAGLVLSLSACMSEGDSDLMHKLPNTEGIVRNEVIVQKLHRNMYDHNLELTGATIKEIGSENETTKEDLEKAFSNRTAAVVYFMFDPQSGVLPLGEVIAISHERGVPVIVDAAAELPPKENLISFVKAGADLVLFSGGKDIGAPNDTGVILGKREFVRRCMKLGPQSYERYGTGSRVFIGRPMKTSKEDIVALAAALRRYLTIDHDERLREWHRKTDFMVNELARSTKLRVSKILPGVPHGRPVCIPRVEIQFVDQKTSAEKFLTALTKLDRPIHGYVVDGKLYLNPQCLKDGEEKIVVNAILKLLSGSYE